MFRLTLPLVAAALLAVPAMAQDAETPVPVIPAPQTRPAPQATDTNLQSEPATITPARKSNCMRDRQVMS